MADTERARYLALQELVVITPRADWIEEIRRIEAAHPEWASGWIPPPPVIPTPPPPPPPSSTTVPPPPPPQGAPPPSAAKPVDPGTRVSIELDDDLMAETVEKTLTVLGARLRIFQSGGRLVELQRDPGRYIKYLTRPQEAPRMVEIGATRARLLAAEECSFKRIKFDKHGAPDPVPCMPPDWLGGSMVTHTHFPNVPVLSALSQAPTLRPDGGLIRDAGYDESTGIFLANDVPVNVPTNPTREDAQQAVKHLLSLVHDFDFVSDAGRSVWLQGVLASVCRHTFPGPAPMTIVDASRRGAGKTMLADVASIITTGFAAPRINFLSDEAEMIKCLLAFGLSSVQFALIDNIVGKFASAPLDAALTSESIRGRVLGKSETPVVPMRIVWWATGNGMSLGNDMSRRSLMVRLEPQTDHPEDRSGPRPGQPWRHPNLIEYIKRERVTYLSSALTIVKAYIDAGRPSMQIRAMGSFEGWSDTIRSALVWAGATDPCDTIEQVREADVQDSELQRLIDCWPVGDDVEVTASTLVALAASMTPDQSSPAHAIFNQMKGAARELWRNALLDWLPPKKGDLPTARELGYALRALKGRIVGDFKIHAGKPLESGLPWKRSKVWGTSPEPSSKPSTQFSAVR